MAGFLMFFLCLLNTYQSSVAMDGSGGGDIWLSESDFVRKLLRDAEEVSDEEWAKFISWSSKLHEDDEKISKPLDHSQLPENTSRSIAKPRSKKKKPAQVNIFMTQKKERHLRVLAARKEKFLEDKRRKEREKTDLLNSQIYTLERLAYLPIGSRKLGLSERTLRFRERRRQGAKFSRRDFFITIILLGWLYYITLPLEHEL